MKNILMLTNIYPFPEKNFRNSTSVCHYFAKEWSTEEYQVKVIYNYTVYPFIFHWLGKLFESFIANVFPSIIRPEKLSEKTTYVFDGISVTVIPIFKWFPTCRFTEKEISRQVRDIIASNNEDSFSPDCITGHFLHPSYEIIAKLKKYYPVTTAVILHGKISSKSDINRKNYDFGNIDIWGFRSFSIEKSYHTYFGIPPQKFLCLSGIPESFIQKKGYLKQNSPKISYIFVGNLVKRKYPSIVAKALISVYRQEPFHFTLVGDGKELKKITRLSEQLNSNQTIIFTGRLDRNQTMQQLSEAHIFVMVSKNETFGLVYLEAMAKGCIVVASEGEGMDGIITHGKNGFLCPAGNQEELEKVISLIMHLSIEQRITIAKNAQETVSSMTDSLMAKNYVHILENQNRK